MTRFSQLAFALVLLLFTLNLYASQIGQLSFATIGDNSEIPQGVATTIMQDRQGFIWVGTQQGLLRYDGYKFITYKKNESENSLVGNYVRSLAQTPDGKIVVGTTSDGLSIFDTITGSFTNYRYQPQELLTLSHNYIQALATTEKGVWAGTGNGLNFIPYDGSAIKHYSDGLKDTTIRSLLLDQNKNLWVGTQRGLYKFNTNRKSFEVVSPNKSKLIEIDDKSIESLYMNRSGILWIGTKQQGVFQLNTFPNP